MSGYHKTLTKTLTAADDDGICLSQTKVGAGALTLNGAFVSGGVATLDTGRRVLITSSGNESGITFTVVGTGLNGSTQTEIVTGPNATTTYTSKDFKTVTSVTVSGSTTGNVKVGTNGIGSTVPFIVDRYVNPANYSLAAVLSGSETYSVEVSYDDLSPAWDINSNNSTWFKVPGFSSMTANQSGTTNGPFTMIKLTNESGTGTVTLTIITPFVAGGI